MHIVIIDAPKVKKTFINKLNQLLGEKRFSIKNLDRLNYSRDSNFRSTISNYFNKVEYFPDVIVWPNSTEEVVELVLLAQKYKMPIVPYGAGSGVAGGTLPVEGGMIIDLKRMQRILKIDTENLLVTSETGVMSLHLEKELQRHGYTLGHFPSSILCCSLGGCLATRSAGQLSSLYGKIEDMVTSLEVVTGTGEIIQTANVSESSGLDLNQIFLGSEGTLGLMTKATLRIYPMPSKKKYRAFRFRNMPTALEAIRRVMQSGLKPSVVRLYDEVDTLFLMSKKSSTMEMPQKIKELKDLVKLKSLKALLVSPQAFQKIIQLTPFGCLVIMIFEGATQTTVCSEKIVRDIFTSLDAKDLGADIAQYWEETRYQVSYEASKLFYEGVFTDTIEVATSWDQLMDLYSAIKNQMSKLAMVMAHVSHVYSDGASLYFTFVAPMKNLKKSEKLYDKIWDVAMKTCLEYKGVISHHHGIGRLKAKYMEEEWQDGIRVFRHLKNIFDPHTIMNPQKLILLNNKRKKRVA